MKRFFVCFIIALFTVYTASHGFANDPSTMDLQHDFFGTWYYEETDMYYTISNDRLVAFQPGYNDGFTFLITNWEIIYNDRANSNDYPIGFKITGIIEEMTGSWWIGIGDADTWAWYISIDKNSLITADESENDIIYFKK
jgi:hypothetical protein